ncbi:MAG: recombinase family protein [Clostridia bacterium]|nr:recombinase family protein [Clostridia bacterium]
MERKIAIYARQSLDKKDSVSIEAQIDECKKFCDSSKTIEVYEDKGFSGKNTNRPQLQKLIADIKLGKIEKVFVYKLDRISRNLVDFYNLKQVMDDNKCEFSSAVEQFDTSNTMGRAMMGILAVFAQMERENIQQRVKDNYYYRIHDGRWAGGPAPFGYKNTKINGFPTLEPIKDELDIVREAFLRYTVKKSSLFNVANELNSRGYKTVKGTNFNNISVRRMLKNPVYAQADKTLYMYFKNSGATIVNPEEDFTGEYSCYLVGKRIIKGEERERVPLKDQTVYISRVKGIVSSNDYITAQGLLKENKQIAGAGRDGTILQELSGKLKCSNCGYAIKAYGYRVPSKKIPYLYCYGNKTKKSCNTKFHGLDFPQIQKEVGRKIQEQIDNLENLEKKEKEIIDQKQNRINEIQIESENLIKLAKLGNNLEVVANELQKLQKEKQDLELQIEVCRSALLQSDLILKLKTPGFYGSKIIYEKMSLKQKKETVQLLIDKILVNPDKTLTIYWKL